MVSLETRVNRVKRLAEVVSNGAAVWPDYTDDGATRYDEIRGDILTDPELWGIMPELIRQGNGLHDILTVSIKEETAEGERWRWAHSLFEAVLDAIPGLPNEEVNVTKRHLKQARTVTDETRIKWVQRISDILSGAIAKWPERPGDANERYYEVRDDMKADAELWALLPPFIRDASHIEGVVELISSPGLNAAQRLAYFQAALENTVQDILKRSREWAGAQIEPAIHEHSGSKITAIAANALSAGVPELGAPELAQVRPRISASSWTGRRTATEQAAYVRQLVPDAVAAIDSLIAEQAAMRRHNNPPEALEDEQMVALRGLRDALTDLLDGVERGRPIEGALGHLRVCIGATFGFAKDTGRLILANAPAVGAASMFGWATYAIATMVAGIEPGVAATMATGKMAVSAIKSKP